MLFKFKAGNSHRMAAESVQEYCIWASLLMELEENLQVNVRTGLEH